MESNTTTTSVRALPERFIYGLRVEVRTTKELHSVLRYLERKMPHWRGEKWDYRSARPLEGGSAVGLGSQSSDPALHIIDGCVTVCHLSRNENTISYSEFLTESRKRGPYKKRTNVA